MQQLGSIESKIGEEEITVEEQRLLLSAVGEASAIPLREGKLLKEKIGEQKHEPVVVKMYEELQGKSKALLVELESSQEPVNNEFEEVRVRSYIQVKPVVPQIISFAQEQISTQ